MIIEFDSELLSLYSAYIVVLKMNKDALMYPKRQSECKHLNYLLVLIKQLSKESNPKT